MPENDRTDDMPESTVKQVFSPDLTKSLAENIDAFWNSLETQNPEFTQILRRGVAELSPLLDQGQLRNRKRLQINETVVEYLERDQEIEDD